MNAQFSRLFLLWLALGAAALPAADPPAAGPVAPRTIVFFGDSLTAGHGLEDPANEAFPALIRKKIEAAHLAWRVVNAGLSGETTSGGVRRVEWILRQPVDVFVLELGGNDGLRGIEPAVSRTNLQTIIDRVRARYPAAKIVLAGMQLPPTLGPDYTRDFAVIYAALAEKNHLTLVPFLLDGVGDRPEFNQRDNIHPTAEGHAIVAETVWKILRPLL
jgi:acyl-CoA thioesterase-1